MRIFLLIFCLTSVSCFNSENDNSGDDNLRPPPTAKALSEKSGPAPTPSSSSKKSGPPPTAKALSEKSGPAPTPSSSRVPSSDCFLKIKSFCEDTCLLPVAGGDGFENSSPSRHSFICYENCLKLLKNPQYSKSSLVKLFPYPACLK